MQSRGLEVQQQFCIKRASLSIKAIVLRSQHSLLKAQYGLPCGKESACSVGAMGLLPGSGRSPREGNGNSFQYSCLRNPMDRGTWWVYSP